MQLATLLVIGAAVLAAGTSALKTSLSKRSVRAKREAGLSDADKQTILHEHNKYRSEVIPTATNMEKMYYDDKIAAVAQQWADTCEAGHDDNTLRKNEVGYDIAIGQNWAGGFPTWQEAIAAWHGEVVDFIYAGLQVDDLGKVGHYTQVVADQACRIGCGYTECPSPNYVCNYAYGQENWQIPYTNGTICADCQTCTNNLCDCGGKICRNGGTLDLKTCTCTCPSLYTDPECGTVDCPAGDRDHCTQYLPEYCTKFTNVPAECPYMCGICEGTCQDTVCKNGGSLVPSNCTCQCSKPYSGADCGTQEPCEGVVCQNGGHLEKTTCTCQCPKLYGGADCGTIQCPAADPFLCRVVVHPIICHFAKAIREYCPFKCSLC